MTGIVAFLFSVVSWTVAIWLTVRVCDGSNEANSLKAAAGWSALLNGVLVLPQLLIQVGIPLDWFMPMSVVFCLVTLVACGLVFWRYYNFSPTKSVVAIPLLGISLAVVLALLTALGLGILVAVKGPQALEQLRGSAQRAAEGAPIELPDLREPEPEPEPDLSRPLKPVEGMPGHYSYTDRQGRTHIVDDFKKVPEEYRQ